MYIYIYIYTSITLCCLVARHRREIQQLIDSARDRARAATANLSSTHYEPLKKTPIRPSSTTHPKPFKSNLNKSQSPSWFKRLGRTVQTFWSTNKHVIIDVFKALIVGILIAGALIILKNKYHHIIPQHKGIINHNFIFKYEIIYYDDIFDDDFALYIFRVYL